VLHLGDPSNGYEEVAEIFLHARDSRIGAAEVREGSKTFSPGSSVLDLGCGHGIPVSRVLIDAGFTLYGIDASPKMIAAFRERCPEARAECSAVEDSEFFARTFDGVVAWGLMFLFPSDTQARVIRKVATALKPAGSFLFTSPRDVVAWNDAITGRQSISLGVEGYERILRGEGLILLGEQVDEGGNHYYLVSKPQSPAGLQRPT